MTVYNESVSQSISLTMAYNKAHGFVLDQPIALTPSCLSISGGTVHPATFDESVSDSIILTGTINLDYHFTVSHDLKIVHRYTRVLDPVSVDQSISLSGKTGKGAYIDSGINLSETIFLNCGQLVRTTIELTDTVTVGRVINISVNSGIQLVNAGG